MWDTDGENKRRIIGESIVKGIRFQVMKQDEFANDVNNSTENSDIRRSSRPFQILQFSIECHEDVAVLGQFCAKIITLRL